MWKLAWRAIRGALGSVFGGGVRDTVSQIARLIDERRDAESEIRIKEIDAEIAQLESVMLLQEASSRRWWSAMMLGQYLVVLPFGIWWAAVFLDSIFGWPLVVQDVPPHLFEMAEWLVPAIIVGAVLARR